jgi:hypothetical protein
LHSFQFGPAIWIGCVLEARRMISVIGEVGLAIPVRCAKDYSMSMSNASKGMLPPILWYQDLLSKRRRRDRAQIKEELAERLERMTSGKDRGFLSEQVLATHI